MTVTIIPLSGFLGAGKTTTMVTAAKALEASGAIVAVITNDQGVDLVDTATARQGVAQVDEVTGGCFCCRFEDLAELVDKILAAGRVDTVLIEAVGSCTDLQATVARPLRDIYGDRLHVAPLTTVVDPLRYRAFASAWERGEESDVTYLFNHQITEADIVAISKADLLSTDELADLSRRVSERYPQAHVVGYSAATGANLSELLRAWTRDVTTEWDVDIDYDRYARAEAELAWLNRAYTLRGAAIDLTAWSTALMRGIHDACRDRGRLIGHVKVRATSEEGQVKLSLVGGEPVLDESLDVHVDEARIVVNARVSCEPAEMDAMLDSAVAEADRATGAMSESEGESNSFKPGYPTPIHRVPARA